MVNGFADLERIKGKIANLDNLIANAISEIDTRINQVVKDQLAAGTDPYGNKWAPKKDGTPALIGIGKYLTIKVDQSGIHCILAKPASYANLTRLIIPNGEIPETWSVIIKDAFSKSFKDIIQK